MNDREAIELFQSQCALCKVRATCERLVAEGKSPCLNLNAISALQEREERSKGCRYCSLGADMKNGEDMEIDLFDYAEGMDFSVYPNFCPMCGRKLKTAMPEEEV